MTRSRKLLLGLGGTAAGILVILLLVPVFFTDRIEARVRAEVERATGLEVSWSDASVGLFGDFPHPSLHLADFVATGVGPFDGDTLVAVRDASISVDGRSLPRALRGRGALVVRAVQLDEPRLRLRANERGEANWDVFPESAGGAEGNDAEGRDLAVSLRRFEIADGSFLLDDARSGSLVEVRGLAHELRGDFSRAALRADTRTHAEAVTARFAGTPYLSDVALGFEGSVDVDTEGRSVRIIDQRLTLNELELSLDGEVARADDGLMLDLALGAPSTGFGSILSLVSTLYARDFATLETAGTFSLRGSVQGRYAEDDFPAFSLEVEISDGSFRYPDLPLPARAISASLTVTNPGGSPDSTVVDLARAHMELGGESLDGSARIRTPVSDPDVDVGVRGNLDLGDLARTVKVSGLEGVSGSLAADAAVRARRSALQSARYDLVEARGSVSLTDVALSGEAVRHPITVRDARLALTPSVVELRSFDASFGRSDVRATGRLENLLGFVLGDRPLRGRGSFTSQRVLLDEWRSEDEVSAIPVPADLDLALEGRIDSLAMNGIEMTDARGTAIVRDERITFEDFTMQALGGRVAVDGFYETVDQDRPTFGVTLDLDSLDLARSSAAVLSFRTLVPVARYAQGSFSTQLALNGALGRDLAPDLDVLEGDGDFATTPVALQGFPLLERLGERLSVSELANPTFEAIRSGIRIENGRLLVHPFRVEAGGVGMTVTGSNGIDQSIDYGLTLEIPRAGFAGSALDALTTRAGALGARLAAIDPVPVQVRATGLVTSPSFEIGLADVTESARSAATAAVAGAAEDAVQERVDAARVQAEEAEAAARREAQARADSVVAAAERQADEIRAEASRIADEVRAQGNRAAEELLARASNPLERAAAQRAADRLRSEAEGRASDIEREADERATALIEEARARAAVIRGGVPEG